MFLRSFHQIFSQKRIFVQTTNFERNDGAVGPLFGRLWHARQRCRCPNQLLLCPPLFWINAESLCRLMCLGIDLINFWATWCPPCVAELRPSTERAISWLVRWKFIDFGRSWRLQEGSTVLAGPRHYRPHFAFDANSALSREMGVEGCQQAF